MSKVIRNEVLEAEVRIRKYIRETPLEHSPYLSRLGNCQVYLKMENLQLTGSFKLRGAANKLLSLRQDKEQKEIVTASTGNHGAAFAFLLKKFQQKGTIYLPENASPTKLELLRLYGADIKLYGNDGVKAEIFARQEAENNGFEYISPYNDINIIGGQGTIGIELQRQIGNMDTLIVPVGGGGLISGIAGFLKSERSHINIIGSQPENSAVMFESLKRGKIIEMESLPTISNGTAGGIEEGAITLDICQKYVDDFTLHSENEIKSAIRLIIEKHYILLEGAGALSVASFLRDKKKYKGQNVVLILSGSKISLDELREIL